MYCPKCGREIPESSAYCLQCGAQMPSTPSSAPTPRGQKVRWTLLAIFVAVVGLFAYVVLVGRPGADQTNRQFAREMAGQPRIETVVKALVPESFTMPAGKVLETRFTVDLATMKNPRVTGRFNASGGSGNDVQVVLASEDDYTNWKNGHEAKVLYGSGKITVGQLDVAIPSSGTYYLAFSNTFSAMSAKTVLADIKLTYAQLRP